MKVLFISPVRPQEGSGIGPNEYAYQLESHMKQMSEGSISMDDIYSDDRIGNIDIILKAHKNAAFRKAIRGIPKNEYDIIHITDHEIGFAAKILKQSGNRAKVFTTIHTLLRLAKRPNIGVDGKAYDRIVNSSTIAAVKYSDMLLCNSSLTCAALQERFGKKRNARTILNGVSDRLISAPLPKRKPKDAFNTGYLGPLYNFKNVTFILNAAAHLREKGYHFYIYGKGPDLQFLQGFKRKNRLINLEMKGYVKEKDKIAVYDGMNAFAFPSLYEGLGMPILEAQSRGLPVVIYQYGAIPKEVRKYCIEATTPENMAQVLKSLRERGYSEAVRAVAARYARSFTWDKTAAKTISAYKELSKR